MSVEQIIEQKEAQLKKQTYIVFSDAEIQELRMNEVRHIVAHFGGHTLMRLPQKEINFFEWLKKEDPSVWDDLWAGEENMYQVSVDLLPQFLREKNGFPICDLEQEDNYYFTDRHIKPAGKEQLQLILEKTERNEKLKVDELLLFELQIAPIDIWHFAYRYGLPLKRLKEVISDMVYKGWIVHLTDREDLLKYIDV